MIPIFSSFDSTFRQLRMLISRSASPRMVTARACAPALPDWPATIGSRIARAVNWAIVDSNTPTTDAARKAVNRLMCSQGKRFLTAKFADDSARSSGLTPTIVCMSLVKLSSAAWKSEAYLTTPTRFSSWSPRGIESTLCLLNISSSSSRGVVRYANPSTVCNNDDNRVPVSASAISCMSTRPNSLPSLSTT